MSKNFLNLLLADDDLDDCFFFEEALEELQLSTKLTTVNDGVQLLELLSDRETQLPDALFLDLNMPRKSGIECLTEIKEKDPLISVPVIVYSTSLDYDVVNLLYEKGAQYYIRKPGEFSNLKKVILKAITLITQTKIQQPAREKFILQP